VALSGAFGREVQLGFEPGTAPGQASALSAEHTNVLSAHKDHNNRLRLVESAERIGVHSRFESARLSQIETVRQSPSVALPSESK